jgi:hypothetical protein
MLSGQDRCAISLAAENQPDHLDMLTLPSSDTCQDCVCPFDTFVSRCGGTSGAGGERERNPRHREVWIGPNRIAQQNFRVVR